jgi:threonine aldolase
MAEAEVGDDVYGEDPTVKRLEAMTAERLGKEAALYVSSGAMGNQVGLLSQTQSGDEIWVHEACHIADAEQAGAAVLGRLQTRMFRGKDGVLEVGELVPWLRSSDDPHNPRQTLVAVENTMGYAGGAIYPLESLERLREFADRYQKQIHIDGARLWNASVATGIALERLAAPGDAVSVCFSKGLGAPVGSALAGSRRTIDRARRARKLLGGGMRQAGVIAAAAVYALEHNVERLRDDHERARGLAADLAGAPLVVIPPPATNMVIARTEPDYAEPLARMICKFGVNCLALDARTIRLVTHLSVSDQDVIEAAVRIRRALDAASEALERGPSGLEQASLPAR